MAQQPVGSSKRAAVGRASWPTRDLSLPARAVERLTAYARVVGLSRIDVATLQATSLPAEPGLADTDTDPERDAARDVLNQIERRWKARTHNPLAPYPSLYEVELPLGVDIAVLRLGPSRPDPDPMPKGGYRRDHKGSDLHFGPDRVWDGCRGYWDFAEPLPGFLVATRLGRILAVFSVDTWLPLGEQDRVYAKSAWVLQPGETYARPIGAGDRSARALSTPETAVLDTFTPGWVIAYPGRGMRPYYRLTPTAASTRDSMRRLRSGQPPEPRPSKRRAGMREPNWTDKTPEDVDVLELQPVRGGQQWALRGGPLIDDIVRAYRDGIPGLPARSDAAQIGLK